MKSKRKIKGFNLIILYLLLISILLISFSLAKYQTDIQKPGTATASTWDFKVELNDIEVANNFQINLVDTITGTNSNVTTGVIAPGSYGQFKITINCIGSETGIKYSKTFYDTNNNIPTNLKFYTSNTYTTDTQINLNQKYEKLYSLTDIASKQDEIIYWRWEATDSTDINANDLSKNNSSLTLGVNLKGEQYTETIN